MEMLEVTVHQRETMVVQQMQTLPQVVVEVLVALVKLPQAQLKLVLVVLERVLHLSLEVPLNLSMVRQTEYMLVVEVVDNILLLHRMVVLLALEVLVVEVLEVLVIHLVLVLTLLMVQVVAEVVLENKVLSVLKEEMVVTELFL
jgi:hypothetical protein